MASTDLDGSKIVILSEADAQTILNMGKLYPLSDEEQAVLDKIERRLRD